MFSLIPARRNVLQVPPNRLDIDSLFRDFFEDPFFPALTSSFGAMKVDIKETDKAYILEADLPGLVKENLRLEYEHDSLTIAVERDDKTEANQDNYLRRERRYSSVARNFAFQDVDSENITAKYDNGVLTVTLTKKEPAPKGTRIQIQ